MSELQGPLWNQCQTQFPRRWGTKLQTCLLWTTINHHHRFSCILAHLIINCAHLLSLTHIHTQSQYLRTLKTMLIVLVCSLFLSASFIIFDILCDSMILTQLCEEPCLLCMKLNFNLFLELKPLWVLNKIVILEKKCIWIQNFGPHCTYNYKP